MFTLPVSCKESLDSPIKYFGLSSLITVFLVKVSETCGSGNLDKVSVENVLCVVVLGTSLTACNV